MAVIHYHLRTDLKNVLTSYSYNNHLNRNAASDYSVTSTQTWSVSDRYFKGHLTIKSGVTLTIKCQVAMTQRGRIFVERGAQLIIDGGTITNISGHPWGSIHVCGDPAQDQSYNPSTGYATYQGMLRIINGGTLSKSGTAITNYTVFGTNTYTTEWGAAGGIVIAENANFIDNARDVEFISYNKPSASYFKNCNFKTTGKIGGTLLPFAHVSLFNVSNVRFMGCTFEYDAGATYANHGIGLFSIDAGYTVDKLCGLTGTTCSQPTLFKNLDYGIRVENVITFNTIAVRNSVFEANTQIGAYLHNINNAIFDQNYFTNAPGALSCGLYLNESKNYNVRNNVFRRQSISTQEGFGIIANKSRRGAHQVYRNTFGGLRIGINATDDNAGPLNDEDGLKMNCNDFKFFSAEESESAITNLYDIAITGFGTGLNMPSVKKVQGVTNSPGPTDLVRNVYAASCGNGNRWYITPSSTVGIAHGCNIGAPTHPTLQPSCSNTLVNTAAFSIALTSTHCPANPASSGGNAENPQALRDNVNTFLSEQRALGSAADPFEFRTALGVKMNSFLTDSLQSSRDTVIQTLSDNLSEFEDGAVQLACAYIATGNFTAAAALVEEMDAEPDWQAMLEMLIDIYQEPDQIYSITSNNDYHNFMITAASLPGVDGEAAALAMLRFVNGTEYPVPFEVPEEGLGERRARPQELELPAIPTTIENITVYPNPAQEAVTVSYHPRHGCDALLEIKDVLGRSVYAGRINCGEDLTIPTRDFSNGVYLVSITKNKELIHKIKLIKQD